MTVSAQTPITLAVGTGAATTFPASFRCDSENDAVAIIDGVEQSAAAFSVTGLGGATCSFVFTTAPANGAKVALLRRSVLQRLTDYATLGDFRSEVVNPDFDRLWLALQEFQTGAQTAVNVLRAPTGESLPALVDAASRAGKILAFDSSGNPVATAPVDGTATALAVDLAGTGGASLVGTSAGITVQDLIDSRPEQSVLEFVPKAQWPAIIAGTSSYMATDEVQAAIDAAWAARVTEAAGSGMYVQEESVPIVNLRGRTLKLDAPLLLPIVCHLDMRGAVLDASSVTGAVFAPQSASGIWKLNVFGGTVKHADTVFDLTNTNQAGGGIRIDSMVFDDVSVEVANVEAQSTLIEFTRCRFLFFNKVVTNTKCDHLVFSDCLFRPNQGAMATDEQVFFENYGKLVFERAFLNPGTFTGTPLNTAWVGNHFDSALYAGGGRSGVFISRDSRFGGENGSLSVVNNYAGAQGTAVGTSVIITGGDAVSANGTREASSGTRRCIVRLFEAPNILTVEDVDGVDAANLIDKATSTALTVTQRIRVTTKGNNGADVGNSQHTGLFIPPELVPYANKDNVRYNATSNRTLNASLMRGSTITNTGTGAATNLFHALPPALPGMDVTFINTASGSGNVRATTPVGETIIGGTSAAGAYYVEVAYKSFVRLVCDVAGTWRQAETGTAIP